MDQPPIWEVHPLLGTMWKTKSSRFHAADRLRTRAWWKGIALSILSAYVLVLSVLPKFIEGQGQSVHRDYVGLIALGAAVLILVLSVISIFDEDKLRSKYMHDNAREIASIHHQYKLIVLTAQKDGQPTPPADETNVQYQAALDRCPYNHDPIDYNKTCIDIEKEKGNKFKLKRIGQTFSMLYDIYFWPILALIAPIFLAFLLFSRL